MVGGVSAAEDPNRWVILYAHNGNQRFEMLVATALGNTTPDTLSSRKVVFPSGSVLRWIEYGVLVPFSVGGHVYVLTTTPVYSVVYALSDTRQQEVTLSTGYIVVKLQNIAAASVACDPDGNCLFIVATASETLHVYGTHRRSDDGTVTFTPLMDTEAHLTYQKLVPAVAYSKGKFVAVTGVVSGKTGTTPGSVPLPPCMPFSTLREIAVDNKKKRDLPRALDGLPLAKTIHQDAPISLLKGVECAHNVTLSHLTSSSGPPSFRFDLQFHSGVDWKEPTGWTLRLRRKDADRTDEVRMEFEGFVQHADDYVLRRCLDWISPFQLARTGGATETVVQKTPPNGKVTILSDGNLVQVFYEDGQSVTFLAVLGDVLDHLCIGDLQDDRTTVSYTASTYARKEEPAISTAIPPATTTTGTAPSSSPSSSPPLTSLPGATGRGYSAGFDCFVFATLCGIFLLQRF